MPDVEVFLNRARQLSSARERLRNDGTYASATALLSVHAAIAFNDALLIKLGDLSARREDHQSAAKLAEKARRTKGIDTSGLRHLKSLLSRKSEVSYGNSVTSEELARAMALASERFQSWVLPLIEPQRRTQ